MKICKENCNEPLEGDTKKKTELKCIFSYTHILPQHINMFIRMCGALSLPASLFQWTPAKCPLLQFSPNTIKLERASDLTG